MNTKSVARESPKQTELQPSRKRENTVSEKPAFGSSVDESPWNLPDSTATRRSADANFSWGPMLSSISLAFESTISWTGLEMRWRRRDPRKSEVIMDDRTSSEDLLSKTGAGGIEAKDVARGRIVARVEKRQKSISS